VRSTINNVGVTY